MKGKIYKSEDGYVVNYLEMVYYPHPKVSQAPLSPEDCSDINSEYEGEFEIVEVDGVKHAKIINK